MTDVTPEPTVDLDVLAGGEPPLRRLAWTRWMSS